MKYKFDGSALIIVLASGSLTLIEFISESWKTAEPLHKI